MVFAQGDIAPPVESVFNAPMPLHQFQQICGSSLPRREVGDAIDGLAVLLALAHAGALEPEDLLDSRPSSRQPLIQFGTGDQFPPFQASMPFGTGLHVSPVTAIGRWLRKEEAQVFLQGRLVGLGEEDVIAPKAVNVCTARLLGV